jgi:tetratricopeptide (TPR) repeat protein
VRVVRESPEDLLHSAMLAPDAKVRARFARRGLAWRGRLDRTTQTMLLRQLYVSLYEQRRFREARAIAESAARLRVLPDVLHHDASRAAAAAGDIDDAIAHLRVAAKKAPASRRSLHLWALGSVLFHAHRYAESIAALERAMRWSTRERPLYRAQLELVRIASGAPATDLQAVIDDLARAPCAQGYGRFVLGHLAYAAREFRVARRCLKAFVQRTASSPLAMGIALEPELAMTRATLASLGKMED